MEDKFYVPTRGEAPPGTKFTPCSAQDHFFMRGSDGRIYTTSRFGFNALQFDMTPAQKRAWHAATGIGEDELRHQTIGAKVGWGSTQYDRDVARLHIEAKRLGFRCVELEGPLEDKYRRVFDDEGFPTGTVKHMRTGDILPERAVPIEQIMIPEPINAESGFKTISTHTLREDDPIPAADPDDPAVRFGDALDKRRA